MAGARPGLPASGGARGGQGFTIVELLVVMGIFAILFSIGIPVGWDFYYSYQLDSEAQLLSSVLQYARNLSLVNHNESDHGLYVTSSNLVIFQGSSYAGRTVSQDKTFPRVSAITITGGPELVFSGLSGQTASTTFSVTDGRKTKYVYMNSEGLVY